MKSFSVFLPVMIAVAGSVAECAGAQLDAAVPAIDPAFRSGLAVLKNATGIIEDQPDRSQTGGKTNLELLVGVKAVKGSKQTIYFVELTTLPPPSTNSAGGHWSPPRQTNVFHYWLGTNSAVNRKSVWCVLPLYPVRLRVFDESGRQLTEGRTVMPWGLGTNGLTEMCRLSLEAARREKEPASADNKSVSKAGDDELDAELLQSAGHGFVWMFTLFGQFQTVLELKNVWASANCAFRLPHWWTIAAALVKGLSVSLEPRFEEVALADPGPVTVTGQWYRLPVDLKSDDRELTSAELVIGPANGAEMLLAGIRSIRAVHPTRPQQEFYAQVLASGQNR